MNMVKKIAFSASILLAMAFTFGCSSDDDDKKKEPDYKWCVTTTRLIGMSPMVTCMELSADGFYTKATCDAMGQNDNSSTKTTLEESKPENCVDCRTASGELCDD